MFLVWFVCFDSLFSLFFVLLFFFPRPLQIQGEQPLQNLLIGEVVGPGVGIQDGMIEGGVEVIEHFRIFQGDDRAGGTVPPGLQVARFAFELLAVLDEAFQAKRSCAER